MLRTLCLIVFAAGILFGCNVQPEPRFWLARPTAPDGKFWQVYERSSWRDVNIDGVRPPSYLSPHILAAGNWFVFVGTLDTLDARNLPILRLRAWNIISPVRRQIAEGTLPDTSGLPWLTRDDFVTLEDFQRFVLNMAAQRWPRFETLERPTSRDAPSP